MWKSHELSERNRPTHLLVRTRKLLCCRPARALLCRLCFLASHGFAFFRLLADESGRPTVASSTRSLVFYIEVAVLMSGLLVRYRTSPNNGIERLSSSLFTYYHFDHGTSLTSIRSNGRKLSTFYRFFQFTETDFILRTIFDCEKMHDT